MRLALKLAIAAGALAALGAFAGLCVIGYVLYNGPRMRIQENIRAYQAPMPPMPAGTVPVEERGRKGGLENPLPATDENCARGKAYYEYYCIFCHGEKGDGNGPVGQSYTPKPSDLASAKIRAYSDAEILNKMLAGEGHEPVLERVVLPEHRWYLVLQVRRFGAPAPSVQQP